MVIFEGASMAEPDPAVSEHVKPFRRAILV